jgi:hypothetical protein
MKSPRKGDEMVKQGILHDYDLDARLEKSAKGQVCVICAESPMDFQWSDYSGEAMCVKCGCTYQLKWGSDKQKEEGNYPYLNLKKEFIPIAQEYWKERGKWVCYGTMMGPRPGMDELVIWLKANHPKWIKET